MSIFLRESFRHLSDVERRRIPPTPPNHHRLHRMERPNPFPEPLVQALRDAASESTGRLYPDYAAFTRSLITHLARVEDLGRLDEDDICLGAGIEDFIRTLMLICCEPGEAVAYPWPTCAMFDVYAEKTFRLKPKRIRTEPFRRLTVDEVISYIDDDTRLLILPNPGQPVETFFAHSGITRIAEACADKRCLVAIDEAYFGFGASSFIRHIGDHDNVIVLRTFSKAMGLAGARVGYAVGPKPIIRALHGFRLSGEVAGPSMAMATTIMQWWPEVSRAVSEVAGMREWAKLRILERGYRVEGSYGNHLLIEINYPDRNPMIASNVAARLERRGWAVRSGMPAPVDHHIMVTCGDRATMRDFVLDFEECLF